MGFFDMLGLYIYGIIGAAATCGFLYFVGKVLGEFIFSGEYSEFYGLGGVVIGLVVVLAPDLWHLSSMWWHSTPDDAWAKKNPDGEITMGQIWSLICWKFWFGIFGGAGTAIIKEKVFP